MWERGRDKRPTDGAPEERRWWLGLGGEIELAASRIQLDGRSNRLADKLDVECGGKGGE